MINFNLSRTTTMRNLVGTSLILTVIIVNSTLATTTTTSDEPNTLPNTSQTKDNQRNDLEATTTSNQTEPRTAARSSSSARSGRMLDLDHLAGDIGKDQKLAKEQQVSGARQSRILSEDLPLGSPQVEPNVEGRRVRPKSGGGGGGKGKKMSIKGFIPIVSLEGTGGGKHGKDLLESQLTDSDDSESANDDDHQPEESSDQQQQQQQNLRDQMAANFGGQTSIGHASFAGNDHQQQLANQQQQQQQWQQMTPNQDSSEAARANRRLLGSSNILSGLTNSKRFMSNLVPFNNQQQFGVGAAPFQHPHHPHNHQHLGSQLQGPMNVPPVASLFEQQQQQQVGECICVPFFQCKNGFLSESQLSKSQLAQIQQSSQQQQLLANPFQVPRSSVIGQQQQQQQPTNELYYSNGLTPANGNNGFPSQANDQQMVNDIYEQLRKNIESSNLEQQLEAYQQQQQQQQQQPQQPLVDERSASKPGSANTTSSSGDVVEERSLLNQLAHRRSSHIGVGGAQKCGIMRTCCRVPPSLSRPLQQQQQQLQQLSAGPRFINQQQPQVALGVRPQPFAGSASSFQPQYQMLQPSRQPPLSPPPPQIPEQVIDYQQQQPGVAAASFLDVPAPTAVRPQLAIPQPPPPPPVGQFMSGRCGQRQTLGISGRVQNSGQLGVENSADFGEFPAHAAILRRLSPGDSLFVCSAVLVSGQWLATAAHCVKKLRPDELKVRLGEWDVNRDDEFYPFVEANVREIHLHPEFQPASLINDLALIRLDTPVDQQQMPHVAPACLATPADIINSDQQQQQQSGGQRCWVAGWGKDAFGQSGAFQSVLKKVDLPVVSHHDCELALKYHTKLGKHFRLHQNNICAGGERGKDACEGDGGAGLYCLDQQNLIRAVGLVSWGVGCGQRGVPGVYVNLANFYGWIESVVAASGEENIYLDGRQQQQQLDSFKNIITERTINGTATVDSSNQQVATTTTNNNNSTMTTIITKQDKQHDEELNQ